MLTVQDRSQVELSVESLLSDCTGKAEALLRIVPVIDEDFPGATNRDALIAEAHRYLDAA